VAQRDPSEAPEDQSINGTTRHAEHILEPSMIGTAESPMVDDGTKCSSSRNGDGKEDVSVPESALLKPQSLDSRNGEDVDASIENHQALDASGYGSWNDQPVAMEGYDSVPPTRFEIYPPPKSDTAASQATTAGRARSSARNTRRRFGYRTRRPATIVRGVARAVTADHEPGRPLRESKKDSGTQQSGPPTPNRSTQATRSRPPSLDDSDREADGVGEDDAEFEGAPDESDEVESPAQTDEDEEDMILYATPARSRRSAASRRKPGQSRSRRSAARSRSSRTGTDAAEDSDVVTGDIVVDD
jgi:hypothetical protein